MTLHFRGADGWHELAIRRHTRARRAKLRIDSLARRPVLTLPPRASFKRAAGWVEGYRGWIEEKLGALPVVQPLRPGARIPFRGEELVIAHDLVADRRPAVSEGKVTIGGPAEAVPKRLLRWLGEEARGVLEPETRALAGGAGLPCAKVSIGDAKTRWGSCSAAGRIRYNWRLILAPPRVLSATVAHEVAHLEHMNHGAAFHALVAQLFGGDPAPERAWLRENGAALYNIGSSLRVAGGEAVSPGG